MARASGSLVIPQGGTLDEAFTFYPDGQLVSLASGYTAVMQIRSDTADNGGTVYATLSTANSGIVLGANGSVRLYMSDDDTADLDFDQAKGDLEITRTSDSKVFKPVLFDVTLEREYTRS